MKERVGFVGMGIMGARMAANILKAGYPLTAWNRDRKKCGPLEAAGADIASTLAELAESSDVVIMMVTGPEAVDHILNSEGGLLSASMTGKCLVNMSTVSPHFSREWAARLRVLDVDFVDAPVSGSKKPAEDGTLVILAGGSEPTVSRLEPLFLSMGKKVVRCGEAGNGSAMKLTVNLLLATMMEGLCEAVNLGRKCGLKTELILDTILSGPMACDYFNMKAEMLRRDEYPPQFPFKHMTKDLRFILETAENCDASVPLARDTLAMFEAGLATGLSDMDFAAVMKVVETGRK